MDNYEAITKAIEVITPLVGDESKAWILWNTLNGSPDFIEAFQRIHGNLSKSARDVIEDAVWEELEEALEGPLHLDLNDLDDSREFQALVTRIRKQIIFKLKGD